MKEFSGGRKGKDRCGAETSDVMVGDTVRMNNSNVIIKQRLVDKVFERNVAHLKKVPVADHRTSNATENDGDLEHDGQPTRNEAHGNGNGRPRRSAKVPMHLQDYQLNWFCERKGDVVFVSCCHFDR